MRKKAKGNPYSIKKKRGMGIVNAFKQSQEKRGRLYKFRKVGRRRNRREIS